jgi:hypothetical protein
MNLLTPELVRAALSNPERLITVSSKRKLLSCPRAFRYGHSDFRIEDNPLALRIGSRWHSVMEALYQGKEHEENHMTLRHWVQTWDDLQPVLSPEVPFLFPVGQMIVGGVIDLVVLDRDGRTWALDHKISTGQWLSHTPSMQTTEQLGVYVAGLRYYGRTPVHGGIVSRLKIQNDLTGSLAQSLLIGEGGQLSSPPPDAWGYQRIENGHITQAVLHGDKTTLRVEREFFPISEKESEETVRDLVYAWGNTYGQDYRVPSKDCLYCPYAKQCLDIDLKTGRPAPEIDLARLHPELMRRLREEVLE